MNVHAAPLGLLGDGFGDEAHAASGDRSMVSGHDTAAGPSATAARVSPQAPEDG
jgi:hypothetical protein